MHEEDEVARRQVDLDKVDGAAGAARELAFQIERADGLGVEERRHEREIEFSPHHADAVLRRKPARHRRRHRLRRAAGAV